MSEHSHSAGSLSISPLGLDGPVVSAHLTAGRKADTGISLLLLVPVLLATVAGQGVRFVSSLSLSLSSLGLNTETTTPQ